MNRTAQASTRMWRSARHECGARTTEHPSKLNDRARGIVGQAKTRARRHRSFSEPTAHINPNHVEARTPSDSAAAAPSPSVHTRTAHNSAVSAFRSRAPCSRTSVRVLKNKKCVGVSQGAKERAHGPLPSANPYAHVAAGYHQHCPIRYYIGTAAYNSRNPPAQTRGTLTARKRACAQWRRSSQTSETVLARMPLTTRETCHTARTSPLQTCGIFRPATGKRTPTPTRAPTQSSAKTIPANT
jgi:hypothetical protein